MRLLRSYIFGNSFSPRYALFMNLNRRELGVGRKLLKAEADKDTPVKFSESKASSYHSYDTFSFAPEENAIPYPKYHSAVMAITIASCILYLCYREENDIDEWIVSLADNDKMIDAVAKARESYDKKHNVITPPSSEK